MIKLEPMNAIKIIVPIKCKFDVNNNFMPTAVSSAQPAAFMPLIAPCTVLFVLNLSKTLATIETIINDVVIPTEAVGVLKIDKIGLYQPVMEGHSLEVLKTHLGHVDGSAYWRGNIGILGHNNGNAGFFKRLTELKVDDVIEYITEDGTRTYKVSEITEIEDTDWSKFARTEDNRITLVTCVRNVPTKRYCVQAIEI